MGLSRRSLLITKSNDKKGVGWWTLVIPTADSTNKHIEFKEVKTSPTT